MSELRHVVFHRPGPNWKPGVPAFEQEGLQHHVEHFHAFATQGKLSFGGPFMDATSGGMMVPQAQVSKAEIEAYAAADPAVRSGLLDFEVRPWLPTLPR